MNSNYYWRLHENEDIGKCISNIKRRVTNKRIKRSKRNIRLIVFSVLILIFYFAFVTGHTKSEYSMKTIKICYGDTLWSIGKDVNYRGDLREFVYKVEEINDINGNLLTPGTEIVVPLY